MGINKTPKSAHLLPGKSLAILPVAGSGIVGGNGLAITGGDFEGEALPIKITVALPILAPVPGHWLPASLGAFDRNSLDVPCSANVCDEDQIEVRVTINGETNSALSLTGHPSVLNRDNSSPELSNVLENRLREIKVLQRRITPTTVVIRERIVGRAEVSSSDNDRAGKAPLRVIVALDFIASTATEAIIEQCSAQSRGVGTVALAIKIAITTSTAHCASGVTATVERSMSTCPSRTVNSPEH